MFSLFKSSYKANKQLKEQKMSKRSRPPTKFVYGQPPNKKQRTGEDKENPIILDDTSDNIPNVPIDLTEKSPIDQEPFLEDATVEFLNSLTDQDFIQTQEGENEETHTDSTEEIDYDTEVWVRKVFQGTAETLGIHDLFDDMLDNMFGRNAPPDLS